MRANMPFGLALGLACTPWHCLALPDKCKHQGCGVQHIMADNLGYFEDLTGARAVNVEDLLRAKGEQVDNRLSAKGISELKMGMPVQGLDGTLEIRPELQE